MPVIPNGCVIYFDEPEFNFGSRFTGEMRLIHEVNEGKLGAGLELVLDQELSLNTSRVYRFINAQHGATYTPVAKFNSASSELIKTNDSPLP